MLMVILTAEETMTWRGFAVEGAVRGAESGGLEFKALSAEVFQMIRIDRLESILVDDNAREGRVIRRRCSGRGR